MNWKTCFLPLLLAAAVLGSVTAFADGEPVGTAKQDEVLTEDTTDGWVENTYTDKQGITYELKDNTITVTDGSKAKGEIIIPATIEKGGISYPVTSVGDIAFENCGALESVTFSGNVGSIGDTVFGFCTALENVTFSGNVGNIGSDAFRNCDGLKTVTFSGDVDIIGSGAFWSCSALDTVTFSGDVGSIRRFAFTGCSALDTLTFSGDVGSIGQEAFYNCRHLNTVTFSGKVDSIGDRAFENCDALKTIYVPASTTEDTIDMIRKALEISGLKDVQIERREPEQPSDPATDPSTPSAPSTGTTGSASNAVQQLEAAERPDPMDVEATERYNFWMDVKSDLRAAGDGRTVRVYVPADYTHMPASVMETIRTLGKEITVDLRWNGQRLLITPATAQQKTALKAYWTFEQLCELYAQAQFESM